MAKRKTASSSLAKNTDPPTGSSKKLVSQADIAKKMTERQQRNRIGKLALAPPNDSANDVAGVDCDQIKTRSKQSLRLTPLSQTVSGTKTKVSKPSNVSHELNVSAPMELRATNEATSRPSHGFPTVYPYNQELCNGIVSIPRARDMDYRIIDHTSQTDPVAILCENARVVERSNVSVIMERQSRNGATSPSSLEFPLNKRYADNIRGNISSKPMTCTKAELQAPIIQPMMQQNYFETSQGELASFNSHPTHVIEVCAVKREIVDNDDIVVLPPPPSRADYISLAEENIFKEKDALQNKMCELEMQLIKINHTIDMAVDTPVHSRQDREYIGDLTIQQRQMSRNYGAAQMTLANMDARLMELQRARHSCPT